MSQPKVFGIGSPKTGTATLGVCLRTLEIGKCTSWNPKLSLLWDGNELELAGLLEFSEEFDSFHDFPWNYFDLYKDLDAAYPDSKFILTIRDSDRWFDSFLRWGTRPDGEEDILWRVKKNPNRKRQVVENFEEMVKLQYGLDEIGPVKKFESNIVAAYDKRNAEVIEHFQGRPDSLLIIDWEKSGGWKELCDFLNVPVPNCPFPHINKGKR
jgi:hypothetical protein